MKSTGIVRRIDNLGRVVLPKEICRTYGFTYGSPVEFFTDNGAIIIKRFEMAGDTKDKISQLLNEVEFNTSMDDGVREIVMSALIRAENALESC